MKNGIKVLIADDNITFGDLLKDYIGQYDDIDVVGVARDGFQAIEMISDFKPDLVILDIIMPNLDGIGVLERIAAADMEKKPLFIMLSAIGQDIFVQKAISLGAEYYVVKPFDIDILVTRIRQIHREKYVKPFSFNKGSAFLKEVKNEYREPQRSIEIEVTNLIREAGIPAHVAGYQYIREAVIRALNSNLRVFSSTIKTIYPEVAQKFNTTPKKVERAIRNAIEGSNYNAFRQNGSQFFSYNAGKVRYKPTNAEFIAILAERVKVNLGI